MVTKSSGLHSIRSYYEIYQKDISKRLFWNEDCKNKTELSKNIWQFNELSKNIWQFNK